MKTVGVLFLGVLFGLLAAGVLLLILSSPRGQPVTLVSPPTPPGLVVYVSGAVQQSGVYTLPYGSRVRDALQVAGGPNPEAYLGSLNLAAPLRDGQHIFVPVTFDTPTPTPEKPIATFTPTPTKSPFININYATQEELESLPGIGEVLAKRIIAYRTRHGFFNSLQDLLKVYGIKPKTLQLIEPYVTFESTP
ncbi:MAG: ComEA family DNA-binding protein [Anaerolineales bacterium]|nr:ComEA family DNA-binding protein [Anaerolineales bacterium]MCS7247439.1 ComEA family DNA-binding protein [Anaerolineales bacterium]MDW8161250.1 ComEA family DNA-binding protein [Anaerolineales bacterium]MDW8445984.1 ComEA family DNA-binding protein [Anaerolineales bacterium]